MESKQPWSEHEVSFLRRYYPNMNNEDLSILLKTRTAHAVSHKAGKLGLKKSDEFMKSDKSGRIKAEKPSLAKRFLNAFWEWYG